MSTNTKEGRWVEPWSVVFPLIRINKGLLMTLLKTTNIIDAMLDINITLLQHEDPRMLLQINSRLIPKELHFVNDCNPFIATWRNMHYTVHFHDYLPCTTAGLYSRGESLVLRLSVPNQLLQSAFSNFTPVFLHAFQIESDTSQPVKLTLMLSQLNLNIHMNMRY